VEKEQHLDVEKEQHLNVEKRLKRKGWRI